MEKENQEQQWNSDEVVSQSEGHKIEQEESKKKGIYLVPTSIRQMVVRDLGKYGATSGVNKIFHLVNCIDYLTNAIGEDVVADAVNKKLDKLKEYQERSGVKTLWERYKNYNEIRMNIDYIRSDLNYIQLIYDDIKDKEMRHTSEKDAEFKKKSKYRKISRKIAPYHFEIYFLLIILLELTDLQARAIPQEAFKTPDVSRYQKTPFIRDKKEKTKEGE